MTIFLKKHVLDGGILFLIIVNVVALGILGWFYLAPAPDFEPPHHFLQNELQLSDVQVQKVDDLRRLYQGKMNILESDIADLKKAMMETAFLSSIDTKKVEQLAEEIGDKHAEREYLRFQHVMDLKDLFQPEQADKFQTIIRDVLRPPRPPHQKQPPGWPKPPRPEEQPRR